MTQVVDSMTWVAGSMTWVVKSEQVMEKLETTPTHFDRSAFARRMAATAPMLAAADYSQERWL